jgi:hypothetical protein
VSVLLAIKRDVAILQVSKKASCGYSTMPRIWNFSRRNFLSAVP